MNRQLKLAVATVSFVAMAILVVVAAIYVQKRLTSWLDDVLAVAASTAAVIFIARGWKHRTPKYRFDLVQPEVVRSPLGFEVRMSKSRLEYAEGNHLVSWDALAETTPAGQFKLSEREIKGWDEPFAKEEIPNEKRRQIFKAVLSALVFRQLVEEGKIRPTRG